MNNKELFIQRLNTSEYFQNRHLPLTCFFLAVLGYLLPITDFRA